MRSSLTLTIVLGLAVVIAAATASSSQDLWRNYKAQFGKRYANATEEALRLGLFNGRMASINAHNERFRRDEVAFELAPSRFTDWQDASESAT